MVGMVNWQPIASAPTDGRWLLLSGGAVEYRWDGHTQPTIVVGQFTHNLNGTRREQGHWQFAWYDGGYLGEYESPTHWMPLPEPPRV